MWGWNRSAALWLMSRTPTLPQETIDFAISEWERVLTENEVDEDWYEFDEYMSYSNHTDCEYDWFFAD